MASQPTRLIAFYLPQFYPIPENDEWWGKGFTEWRNVAKARPLFKGHYQPHIPADLGFYDLRLPEVREAQADLAREYGIFGFCYYHYWFNGRRLLERPFNEVLASGRPNFPFCLCWANENWTRAWDGTASDVLLSQDYSFQDDLRHIESLIPAFHDERYIRINDKPIFLVYRTELMPNPSQTAQIWRDAVSRAGLGDLYLIRVESFVSGIHPTDIGFDAAAEFAPDWRNAGGLFNRSNLNVLLTKLGLLPKVFLESSVSEYQCMVDSMLNKRPPPYLRFRCVTPSWDNSPRRSRNARIFVGSTPERYGGWLRSCINQTLNTHKADECIVFINAWNEWGESNHLEPDLRWGKEYLQATAKATSESHG